MTATYDEATGLLTATGLPTDQVINLLVHRSGGTLAYSVVLGYTTDGAWTAWVPPAYRWPGFVADFTGRTSGKDGTKYHVYAEYTFT